MGVPTAAAETQKDQSGGFMGVAAPAIGAGASALQAVGNITGGKAQRKAEKERFDWQKQQAAGAQKRLDDYLGQYGAWQAGLPLDQLVASAMGPQVTTSQMSSFEAPELLGPAKEMAPELLSGIRQRLGEAEAFKGVLPGERERIARDFSAAERQLGEQVSGRLAGVPGVAPGQIGLETALLGQPLASARLTELAEAPRRARDQYLRETGELSKLAQMVLGQFYTGRRSRGTQRTEGPANIGAALAALGLGAPMKPDVILPS